MASPSEQDTRPLCCFVPDHDNTGTTFSVRFGTDSARPPVTIGCFDQSRKHVETSAGALMSPHIHEALGHDAEG